MTHAERSAIEMDKYNTIRQGKQMKNSAVQWVYISHVSKHWIALFNAHSVTVGLELLRLISSVNVQSVLLCPIFFWH